MNIMLYIIMCFIYGSTFLFIKIGVTAGFDPFFFGFSRFIIAGITMIGFLKLKSIDLRLSNENLKKTATAGFFLVTVCFGSMNWAEQYISSGLAAILVATTPFVVIMINKIQSKDKIASEEFFGFIVSIIGLILIMKSAINDNYSTTWLLGILVMLLGVFGFAYGTVYAKKVITNGVNVFVFNGYQMLFGSLGLILLSILVGESYQVTDVKMGLLSLAYLAIGGSLTAATIYHYLISKTGSFFPTTWTYISPIISLLVGYFVLAETLTWMNVLGAFVVIIGLVISNIKSFESIIKLPLSKLRANNLSGQSKI